VRIDVHTHVVVNLPDFAERYDDVRWPSFRNCNGVGELLRDGRIVRRLAPSSWSTEHRITDMDASGVDMQVLSPIPPLVVDWADAAPGRAWAEEINSGIADLVAEAPDRFVGIGTIPVNQPEAAVAVLEQVSDLGLRGVEIGCAAGSRELDDPGLRPVFAAAERLGLVVFIHPLILGACAEWTDRIVGPELTFGLGMTTDTAIAAARLAFGGVTEDHPGLKVLLAHGGGTFFWALPRIAHLWDRVAERPRAADLTAHLYADSVVYDAGLLARLCAQIGAQRIAFGTDYPLPAQDDLAGATLSDLDDLAADAVGGRTAAALFSLKAER